MEEEAMTVTTTPRYYTKLNMMFSVIYYSELHIPISLYYSWMQVFIK